MEQSAFKKASRKQVFLKIGLFGASGTGKTMSALVLAKGMLGSLEDIYLIDTEGGSSEMYSHLGEFNVARIDKSFEPQNYINLIVQAYKANAKCIIIDSISHCWAGTGGTLDHHAKSGGNFAAWRVPKAEHQRLVDTIVRVPLHVIVTGRKKTDYVIEMNEKGKVVPRKVGLKTITEDTFEFELGIAFDIEPNHHCSVSKDRTSIFSGRAPFMITEETGQEIIAWNNSAI